jgi:hypothetical protein
MRHPAALNDCADRIPWRSDDSVVELVDEVGRPIERTKRVSVVFS